MYTFYGMVRHYNNIKTKVAPLLPAIQDNCLQYQVKFTHPALLDMPLYRLVPQTAFEIRCFSTISGVLPGYFVAEIM